MHRMITCFLRSGACGGLFLFAPRPSASGSNGPWGLSAPRPMAKRLLYVCTPCVPPKCTPYGFSGQNPGPLKVPLSHKSTLKQKNRAMAPKLKGTGPLFKKCALDTLSFHLYPFRPTFLFKKAPTKISLKKTPAGGGGGGGLHWLPRIGKATLPHLLVEEGVA